MRMLVQRVKHASVTIDGRLHSRTGAGLLVFVGVGLEDTSEDAEYLAGKLVRLRIFDDEAGDMTASGGQRGGVGRVGRRSRLRPARSRGHRPSYVRAAPEAVSRPLYEGFAARVAELLGRPVATGVFGADMQVELLNDGPVTIWMDSENRNY